jgi:hypothetical protein
MSLWRGAGGMGRGGYMPERKPQCCTDFFSGAIGGRLFDVPNLQSELIVFETFVDRFSF